MSLENGKAIFVFSDSCGLRFVPSAATSAQNGTKNSHLVLMEQRGAAESLDPYVLIKVPCRLVVHSHRPCVSRSLCAGGIEGR
jgi:hypothetical protein